MEFLAELEAVAGAAYGEEWEEEGRRRLAGLAALLLVLFPSAQPIPGAATALATTVLPDPPPPPRRPRRTGRVLTGAAIGVVLLLLIGGYAAGALRGHPTTVADEAAATPQAATRIDATTTPSGTGSSSPSASVSPSPPASASASGSPSASVPAIVTPSAPPGMPSDTSTASPTATPSTAVTPSASPSPTAPSVKVSDLQIDLYSIDPNSYVATMVANVTTDGPGTVTVTVHWTVGPDKGTARTVASQTITLSGSTRYLRVRFADHSFAGQCGQYLGAYLSTAPAAANGTPSTTSYEGCPIR